MDELRGVMGPRGSEIEGESKLPSSTISLQEPAVSLLYRWMVIPQSSKRRVLIVEQ